MNQHTPGRLEAIQFGNTHKYAIGPDVSTRVCEAYYEANARRLVACWNACEGISTESLESAGNAFNGWRLASYALDDAKAQRDELLKALKHIEGMAMADEWRDLPEIAKHARAAIAKVQGGEA